MESEEDKIVVVAGSIEFSIVPVQLTDTLECISPSKYVNYKLVISIVANLVHFVEAIFTLFKLSSSSSLDH